MWPSCFPLKLNQPMGVPAVTGDFQTNRIGCFDCTLICQKKNQILTHVAEKRKTWQLLVFSFKYAHSRVDFVSVIFLPWRSYQSRGYVMVTISPLCHRHKYVDKPHHAVLATICCPRPPYKHGDLDVVSYSHFAILIQLVESRRVLQTACATFVWVLKEISTCLDTEDLST